jgi:predicted nucleic acid-binding protein
MAARTRRAVVRPAAFWDASALVPLWVHQANTPQARAWYKAYEIVVWWSTPVEIASALARISRLKYVAGSPWEDVRQSIVESAETWYVISPSAAIQTKAIKLVEHYTLRAADAMQLAAAFEWCEYSPRGRTFLTCDDKLRQPARSSGFQT